MDMCISKSLTSAAVEWIQLQAAHTAATTVALMRLFLLRCPRKWQTGMSEGTPPCPVGRLTEGH